MLTQFLSIEKWILSETWENFLGMLSEFRSAEFLILKKKSLLPSCLYVYIYVIFVTFFSTTDQIQGYTYVIYSHNF